MYSSRKTSFFVFGFLLFACLAWPQSTYSGEKTTMILATVGPSDIQVKIIDGRISKNKPGWVVELSRRAVMQCDADIEINFIFAPWSRALQLVKYGDVAAAFISSYKVERTEYGVYPLKDGNPDESRAFKRYAYNAYVRKGSTTSYCRFCWSFCLWSW